MPTTEGDGHEILSPRNYACGSDTLLPVEGAVVVDPLCQISSEVMNLPKRATKLGLGANNLNAHVQRACSS